MEPLLSAKRLSKTFGTLSVVRQVDLDIFPGEVVGLIGQSGSGKSTLARLLAGFYSFDEGELYFGGKQIQYPFNARNIGIEIIHQTPNLAENLDITSNIFLGNEIGWPPWGKWLKIPKRNQMHQEAKRILSQLDLQFASLRDIVTNLSSEQRQMISIARVMAITPKLIIVDDPTLLLSYPYQQKLLSLIQIWQEKGIAILFSSNNLDHLLATTDRIVVLHKGKQTKTFQTDEAERDEILAAVVGTTDRQQLTPIIWALDSYYRAREQAEKLQHNRALLEKDIAAQDNINRKIFDQLSEQISVLDSVNLALQDAQRRLLTELEKERKHLAREIHDQVIQDLLSTIYQLEEVEVDGAVPHPIRERLAEIRSNTRNLIDELRDICGSLRPPTIDSLGLGAAVQSFTRDWTRRTGIPVALHIDANLKRLPEAIELSVFRILQEGLSNVQKHANANNVLIDLKHTSPRALMVAIADDGKGLPTGFDFSDSSSVRHYGLLGISERVTLLGGRLSFKNQERGGLLIQVEIPHPKIDD